MALALARTNAEAHLYMDLHPCPCGEVVFDRQSAVVEAQGDLATHYAGPCSRCGTQREFLFRLPAEVLVPAVGQVQFGGAEPSELLDPGEWLWVSDAYASRGPADVTGLGAGEREDSAHDLATAVAAIDEALKFVPAGAEAVPESAFWSERGRAVRAEEPGRFRVSRLEAVRGAYRQLYAAASS
jgi:hypothetical protein